MGSLTFDQPDYDAFRCLKLAEIAGKTGGTLPCVLNAANEVAVDAFLKGLCSFTDIDHVVAECMDAHSVESVQDFDQLADIDARTRRYAEHVLSDLR